MEFSISHYRIAIERTTATLDRRAKHFRNLIVAVTFVGLGSTLWAGLTWSWLPLTGTFLFIPLCGLYLFIDGSLLSRWRLELFSGWERGEIDLSAFRDAIILIPTLPTNSIDSMLAMLPIIGDLVAEQGISSSTRRAIAGLVTTINTCRSDAIIIKTVVFTIIGCVIIAAIAFWQWQPLLGMAAVGLTPLLQKWVKTKRLRCVREIIRNAQKDSDFSLQKFKNLADSVQWAPISVMEKQTLLSSFSKPFKDS